MNKKAVGFQGCSPRYSRVSGILFVFYKEEVTHLSEITLLPINTSNCRTSLSDLYLSVQVSVNIDDKDYTSI